MSDECWADNAAKNANVAFLLHRYQMIVSRKIQFSIICCSLLVVRYGICMVYVFYLGTRICNFVSSCIVL